MNATTPAQAAPAVARTQRPDRRRARTRGALLEAGRVLLASRDVDALSVDEIVAAADVAKGSFYNHFADKDVFAREIGAAVRRQAEEAVSRANAGVADAAVRVARALCVFIRFAIEHRDSAQLLWRLNSGATIADAPVNRGLREEVLRAHRQRRLRRPGRGNLGADHHGHRRDLHAARARGARRVPAAAYRRADGHRHAARARGAGAARRRHCGPRGRGSAHACS